MGQSMKQWVGAILLLVGLGGCASTKSAIPPSLFYKHISVSYLVFHAPWYQEFLAKYHRKPHLEIVELDDASYRAARYGMNQEQITYIDQDIEAIREKVAATRKAVMVSYAAREFDSSERLFEMEHAASDSIAEPGHVKGADFVLVLRPGGTLPYRYETNFLLLRALLDMVLIGVPEIVFYPLEGPFYGYHSTVSMSVELVDLRTDENVWSESIEVVLDTIQGITQTVTNTSEPTGAPFQMKYVGDHWIAVQ